MDGNPQPLPPRHSRNVDPGTSGSRRQSPQRSGTPMTEQGTLAAGKHSSHPTPSQGDPPVAPRVHASMHRMELSCFDPTAHCPQAQTGGDQLPPRYHPMLASGQRRQAAFTPCDRLALAAFQTCRCLPAHMDLQAPARRNSPPSIGLPWVIPPSLRLEVADLGCYVRCGLFGVGEEHRGVRFVEEVVVDAGEAGAERALDHDHLLGL